MLLVTRPRQQALEWAARLQAAGIPAAVMPLLGIHPAPDADAVRRAWHELAALRAVMFVSPNAVAGFFHAAPPGSQWPHQTLAVAPGPGTAAALMERGVRPGQIIEPPADAQQFDSESLWPELARHSWVEAEVLVARGEGGRDWLIQRWKEAGARVRTVVAYTRGAPEPSAEEAITLQAAVERPEGHIWLLSSSEALDHLMPLVRASTGGAPSEGRLHDQPDPLAEAWLARAQILATHPRIAEHAIGSGLRRVTVCRADFPAVVAAYNRLHREP